MNNPLKEKSDVTSNTIALEFAMERLRQDSETFSQVKLHGAIWFYLRLSMGIISVIVLPLVAVMCGYIIINHEEFNEATITAATGTLFVDVIGLMIAVWKIVLNPTSITELKPVTDDKTIASFHHSLGE